MADFTYFVPKMLEVLYPDSISSLITGTQKTTAQILTQNQRILFVRRSCASATS